MSAISGSCGESASRVLFEKGIQQHLKDNDIQQKQQENNIELAKQAEQVSSVTEGNKGTLFDGYA